MYFADLLPDLELENDERDILHCQISNGWFYEAVSQAEQAIEDLFSLMMNLVDIDYFAKNVVHYSAAKVKDYIWDFQIDDFEYICKQFGMPWFPLDEPWEKKDVFERYKEAVLRTQAYVKELQEFHKKYYLHYCQYKHGLSVALTPMQNPLMKNDTERRDKLMENPMEGCLQTFHQGMIGQYEKRTGTLPVMCMLLKPDIRNHVREFHDEGNLLFFTMHHMDMEMIVRITEHVCVLIGTLWKNIIWRCEEKDDDEFSKVAFPSEDLNHVYEIEFPKGSTNRKVDEGIGDLI